MQAEAERKCIVCAKHQRREVW